MERSVSKLRHIKFRTGRKFEINLILLFDFFLHASVTFCMISCYGLFVGEWRSDIFFMKLWNEYTSVNEIIWARMRYEDERRK
jgi:hypothetical protein